MLEVKLIVHGNLGSLTVGSLSILQVAQHEGTIRDYAVTAQWQPLDSEDLYTAAGSVLLHDRNEVVWSLVKKAIEALTPPVV